MNGAVFLFFETLGHNPQVRRFWKGHKGVTDKKKTYMKQYPGDCPFIWSLLCGKYIGLGLGVEGYLYCLSAVEKKFIISQCKGHDGQTQTFIKSSRLLFLPDF